MGGSVSLFEENNWELANGKIEPITNNYTTDEGLESIPTYQRARNHTQTVDGSPPTTKYQIYWLTKRGTFNLNQREYDITDEESNLLYTTKAVPGTLACFDLLHGITQKSILRISVDLSRRYWIVYRFHHPIYPGQYPDQSEQLQTLFQNDPKYQLEILNYQMMNNTTNDNDIDDDDDNDDIIEQPNPPSAISDSETPLPGLYKVCCVTVSWSRYMAVSTMYGPPTEQQIDHYLQRQLVAHEEQQQQGHDDDKEMLPQLLLYDNTNNNDGNDNTPNIQPQPPTPTTLIDETITVAYERSIEVPRDPSTRFITDTTSVVNEGSIEVPPDVETNVDDDDTKQDNDNGAIEPLATSAQIADEQRAAEISSIIKADDTVHETNDNAIENAIKSNVDGQGDSTNNNNHEIDMQPISNNETAIAVDTENTDKHLPTNELTETENDNNNNIHDTPKSIVSAAASSLFDTLSSSSSVGSSSKDENTDKNATSDGQQQQYVPNRTRAVSECQQSEVEQTNNDYPLQRVGESMPNLLGTSSSHSDIVQIDSRFDEMDEHDTTITDQVDTTTAAAASAGTTQPEEPVLLVPFKSNYNGFSYKTDIIKKKREKRLQALKSWLPKRNTSSSHRSENYGSESLQSPDTSSKGKSTTDATNLPSSPSLDPNERNNHQSTTGTKSEPSSPATNNKESCLPNNDATFRTSKSVSPKDRKARPVLTFLNKSISAASTAVSTSIANSSITNSITSNGITTTRASALLTTIKSSVTSSGNSTTPNLASSGIPGADEDNPLLGTIDLDNKPIVLCQEIYNKIIGNWQTSRITKHKALELLKADAKQQRAAEKGGITDTIDEEQEEEQEVETKNNTKAVKKDDGVSFGMKFFNQIQAKIKDDNKASATTNIPSTTDNEVPSNDSKANDNTINESQEESIESFRTKVGAPEVESEKVACDHTVQILDGTPNPELKTNSDINETEPRSDDNNDGEDSKDENDAKDGQPQEQPLIGYWNWENTMRTHRMKLHLAAGSDLALHIVIAILVNQVRYERNAIALTV